MAGQTLPALVQPSMEVEECQAGSDAAATARNVATAAGKGQPSPAPLPLLAPHPQVLDFGWVYNQTLEPDDNYLDLALAVSRNSLCDGGHMGCVFVRPSQGSETPSQLLILAVNSTLIEPDSCKSDVHAEQNAIAVAAKRGLSLDGSTAYITMPPCKTCFGLLHAAGVKRVVFRRRNHLPELDAAAERLGMALVGNRGNQSEDESLQRVMQLWEAYRLNHPEMAELDAAAKKAKQQAMVSKKRKAAERLAKAQQDKAARTDETGSGAAI